MLNHAGATPATNTRRSLRAHAFTLRSRSQDHPFYEDEVSRTSSTASAWTSTSRGWPATPVRTFEKHTPSSGSPKTGTASPWRSAATTASRHIEAKMVAGCDGPSRASVGRPDWTNPRNTSRCPRVRDEVDHGDFVDVHLTVRAGLRAGAPTGRGRCESDWRCRRAMTPAAVSRTSSTATASKLTTAVRDSSRLARRASHRPTVFLIGDAAAQTKPFTGGGIRYGMTAADHAAREIDPDDPATLGEYERAWRTTSGRKSPRPRGSGRLLCAERSNISDCGASGEIGVHMDKPTSFFSREHLTKLLRSLTDVLPNYRVQVTFLPTAGKLRAW